MPSPCARSLGEPERGRRLRTLLIAGAVGLVGLGVTAAWDLHVIGAEMGAGRRSLDGLTLDTAASDGLSSSAERAAAHLTRAAARAHHSIGLAVLGELPVVDRQIVAIRRMSDVTNQLGDSAVRAAHRLDSRLERAEDPAGRIAVLDTADEEIVRMRAELREADLGRGDDLVGPVRRAHTQLAASIRSARAKLADGRALLEPVRDALAGPSTFVLLAANNAEMAGGSGLALSAGGLRLDGGGIRLGKVVPAGDLRLTAPVPVPGDLGRIYEPTGIGLDLRSATRSPNLPVMGAVVSSMLTARGYPYLDGVLIVDPLALSDIMRVSGGVKVRGVDVNAANVVPEVLHENYRRFDLTGGDQDARASYQGEIAQAVFESLTTRRVPALQLANALLTASKGRHLQLWGADPKLQRAWEDLGVAGALDPHGLLISFQNYGADKMDWYLRPSASLSVRLLPSGDYRARLTLSLRVPSRAETADASPYILGPDPDTHGVFLTVHLPAAAHDITTPDESGFRTKGVDPPMQVRTFLDNVPAGSTLKRHLEFTLPRETSSMTLLPSARLEPLRLTVDGRTVVSDDVARRFTWSAAQLPATNEDWSPWVGVLLAAGVVASITTVASGLAERAHRHRSDSDARHSGRTARRAAIVAAGCFVLAAILAIVLATPRV